MSSHYDFDLSGNRIKNWEFFPETVAAFSVPQTLEGDLSMLVWGVILIDPHREPDFALRFLSSEMVCGSKPSICRDGGN